MSSLPAKPVIKRSRRVVWVWLVPLFAAIAAGIYFHSYFEQRGPLITIKFKEVNGLKPGETRVLHRGAEIGKVESVELSKDRRDALVKVRLRRDQEAFAKKGATFWVVRPEISESGLSGLNTILSGSYLGSAPGWGEKIEKDFEGLSNPPEDMEEGLKLILHTAHLNHVQTQSPVFYRGIQVGDVREIHLSDDASNVDIEIVVWRHFEALVRDQSQFWVANGFDLKGGLFSGAELKISSIKTLISGGISFATPEKNMGDQAKEDTNFTLQDQAKKEWTSWAPKIPL